MDEAFFPEDHFFPPRTCCRSLSSFWKPGGAKGAERRIGELFWWRYTRTMSAVKGESLWQRPSRFRSERKSFSGSETLSAGSVGSWDAVTARGWDELKQVPPPSLTEYKLLLHCRNCRISFDILKNVNMCYGRYGQRDIQVRLFQIMLTLLMCFGPNVTYTSNNATRKIHLQHTNLSSSFLITETVL